MIAVLLLSLLAAPALAWDQRPNLVIEECADDIPFGVPVLGREAATTLKCNTGYALLHDNSAKIAVWAGWTVTPVESVGCIPRADAFVADAVLSKGQRAEASDYSKTGFDKGHMVPDADLSWDQQAEYESFLMSNMSPQYPNLNRGAWKQLEATTRAWALQRGHAITVYSGNVYTGKQTIGANKVVVPETLYKIVVDGTTGEVLAFTFPNIPRQEINLAARLTSVASIEEMTGVRFPLPEGADRTAVATDVWPADLGAHAASKKAACSARK